MENNSVLEIIAHGAWNGGTLMDNREYVDRGMVFKGDIPVNPETIESRIGVRTRMKAPEDERIGLAALENLLDVSDLDPTRIKLIVGATNVGDDKYEVGPLIEHPFNRLRALCPDAMAMDLYAGCPGFNVSVELVFMLSLSGVLKKDDLTVIIGAENIHRARAFRSTDTANIIFGDDALATALQTRATCRPRGNELRSEPKSLPFDAGYLDSVARTLLEMTESEQLDGIIVDNQLGKIQYRVPATTAWLQQRLTELRFPAETEAGTFSKFTNALSFYNEHVRSFAFDIRSLERRPDTVHNVARAYIESGKQRAVASVYLDPQADIEITIHRGKGYSFQPPPAGVIDTITSTHGCFGSYIQADVEENDVFGEMNGKGVFLYATRGAGQHLERMLAPNGLAIDDLELLIEHQANFAMIPMTLQNLFKDHKADPALAVKEFIADKMVMNIHTRGNCSVVCMQRLPYDLERGTLQPDTIQGFPINRNIERLQKAKLILFDSVGAGMTRSSFIYKK